MSLDFWNYEPRRPRHEASEIATTVLLRRIDSEEDWLPAELGDISRNGARLRHGPPLDLDDRIEMLFPFEADWLKNSIVGTIRWARDEPSTESERQLACEFDEPLDWEVLGELILCGALKTDASPEKQPNG